MRYIAIRMLVRNRLKYVGLVAGLSLASFLMTQQGAIFAGYAFRTIAWLEDTQPADLWVMDPQMEFSDDQKPIRDSALQRIRGIAGVEWAVPMFKSYLKIKLPDGTTVSARVVGIDDSSLVGGPPEMVEGSIHSLRQDKAVLVDSVDMNDALRLRSGATAAEHRALQIGDRLDINEHEAVVTGSFRRTKEFFWEPIIYTTYSRAVRFAPRERRVLSYILVKVKPGQDMAGVGEQIRSSTGYGAYSNDQFKRVTMGYILKKTGILVNFGITILLGFFIGALISAQLLYNFVLENERYYAAMKAMGATNGCILRMILSQVLVAGSIGFGIGSGLASLSGLVLGGGAFAFRMTWHIPVVGVLGVLSCCIVAAIISSLRVLRLEPAMVFRG